jgi:hypothetical protein
MFTPATTTKNENDRPPERLTLLREVDAAQAKVRARAGPDTWRAFWMIAIEQRPVREVADTLGKTSVAVYEGHRRVERMLREE